MADTDSAAARPSRRLGGIFKNSSFYLFGNVASRVVGFLAIPIYSRFLSPAEYGVIELIELSTQVVAVTFGMQSIGTIITRLYHDQTTSRDEGDVISTGLIATACVSACIAIVAILAAAPISQAVFHSTDKAPLLQAAFAAMFFSNLLEVVLIYERIREHARFFLVYSLVTLALTLGLNIYFIGVLGAGVWGFIYSKLLITGFGSLYLLWRAFRDVGWNWRSHYIPQFFRFGLPLVLASVSFFAIHFSDRFFLSAAVSLADLGRYALAYRFAFLVSVLVSDSFGKSWNVTFYRHVGEPGWRAQFGRVAKYLMFVECLAGVALSLAAPELFYVMVPKSFYPPALLLPILVLAYVLRDFGDFFRNLLLINKRSVLIGRLVFAGAILNAGLNMALIPSFGLYGAGLATLATWSAYLVVFWVLALKEHDIPSQLLSVLTIVPFAAATVGLRYGFPASDHVGQILLDAGWLLLFVAMCLLFYFSATERSGIYRIAGNFASRVMNRPEPAARTSTDALLALQAMPASRSRDPAEPSTVRPGRPRQMMISGWYGHGNAGDEAILGVFLDQLGRDPPWLVHVLTSAPEAIDRDYAGRGAVGERHWEYVGLRGLENLLRGRVGKPIRRLMQSDMLIFGGGSILRDNTSWTNLLRLLDDILLARLFGVPVVFYAIGVGPFRSWLGRRLIAIASRCATAITVRDETSAELLRGLGVKAGRIAVVSDPAFLLADADPELAARAAGLTDFLAVHPRSIFVYPTDSLTLPAPAAPEESLIASIAGALQTLAEADAYAIVFVPLRVTGGSDDVAMSRRIQRQLPPHLATHVVQTGLPAEKLRALTRLAGVNLAVRLHAMIFAASCGVPSVAINYEPKVRANATRFGLARYVVEPQATLQGNIVAAVRDLASAMPGERAALAGRLPELRRQARIPFAVMARVIGRKDEAPAAPPVSEPHRSGGEALRPGGG